jgi:tetratricopeptide (TPR) repeat protein
MMRVISILLLAVLPALGDDSFSQGLQAFHAGRYAEARGYFEQSKDSQALVFLALVQAATGGCTEAVPRLAAAFAHPVDATIRRFTGEALLSCIESNLRTDYPSDADVLYQSARAHLRAWNDIVYQMFQKNPGSYRVNQMSGEIFEIQGKYREAATEYRKAIEKNPRALDLHFRLGRVILIDSQGPDALENARREFEAELALNAGDAAAEYEVGQILIAQSRRDAGANHLERALTLRPDFVEALLAVGRARLQDKRYEEAISLLNRAVKLRPQSEPAHYSLMMAYRNSGDLEAAKREKAILDQLQKPPEGEFTEFLKKLGEKSPVK